MDVAQRWRRLARPRPVPGDDRPRRWFASLARFLTGEVVLRAGDHRYRLAEVEFYYRAPDHDDPFPHQANRLSRRNSWYFHRSGTSYRGGTFKGLDLTFGSERAPGGVLLRALIDEDDQIISGPNNCVEHLLVATGTTGVADLDRRAGALDAWDPASPLALELAGKNPPAAGIYATARIGLSLRRVRPTAAAARYLVAPYRFVIAPRRNPRGKPHLALALHAAGASVLDVQRITGSPPGAIARYIAGFERGRRLRDLTRFAGVPLDTTALAQLHGMLLG